MKIIDKTSGQTISYTYDEEGKRISSHDSATGETIHYFYDGDHVLFETDANNNVVREYTYNEQGIPLTMTIDQDTYYYLFNHHGDIVGLTDSTGNVVASYTYDAWGNILSQTGPVASVNPYRYAGYRYDENTKLYYLMARYYEPKTGRFLSKDPIRGFLDEPLSLNQYIYTQNNPVLYIDPSGQFRVISVSWAATLFDVSLGALAGGGAGAIAAYIRKKGKKAAAKMFTKTVKSRLVAWGAPKLAYAVAGAVAIAMDRLEIGKSIAEYLDKIDKKPNNGWLDI